MTCCCCGGRGRVVRRDSGIQCKLACYCKGGMIGEELLEVLVLDSGIEGSGRFLQLGLLDYFKAPFQSSDRKSCFIVHFVYLCWIRKTPRF